MNEQLNNQQPINGKEQPIEAKPLSPEKKSNKTKGIVALLGAATVLIASQFVTCSAKNNSEAPSTAPAATAPQVPGESEVQTNEEIDTASDQNEAPQDNSDTRPGDNLTAPAEQLNETIRKTLEKIVPLLEYDGKLDTDARWLTYEDQGLYDSPNPALAPNICRASNQVDNCSGTPWESGQTERGGTKIYLSTLNPEMGGGDNGSLNLIIKYGYPGKNDLDSLNTVDIVFDILDPDIAYRISRSMNDEGEFVSFSVLLDEMIQGKSVRLRTASYWQKEYDTSLAIAGNDSVSYYKNEGGDFTEVNSETPGYHSKVDQGIKELNEKIEEALGLFDTED